MSRLWELLRGATFADALVALSALSVVAVLLRPTWSANDFRERVQTAIADVDALEAAAQSSRDLQGRWPSASPPGEAPPQLSVLGGPDGILVGEGYTLGWSTWELVDSVVAPLEPGPPSAAGDAPREPETPRMMPVATTVGAVSVHSAEEALLAELLGHYGRRASFVIDTIWMLVLPERDRSIDGGACATRPSACAAPPLPAR